MALNVHFSGIQYRLSRNKTMFIYSIYTLKYHIDSIQHFLSPSRAIVSGLRRGCVNRSFSSCPTGDAL